MKKVVNVFRIAFSSMLLWPSLLIAYVFFIIANYLLMQYVYSLMIVNTDYLFFWYPEYYSYNTVAQVEGPQPVTRVIFFVILVLFLYFTNYKKTINPNFAGRACIFVLIYFIISSPSESDSFSTVSKAIDQLEFSPVENFMKDTKRDFKTGYVSTPMGKFKMYKKENTFEDRLYKMESLCNDNIMKDEEKYCYDYPFRSY